MRWNDDIKEPFTEEAVNATISSYLKKSFNYIGIYLVQPDENSVSRLPDVCQMDSKSMGCEHGCHFDKDNVDFVCTCPDQMELAEDKITCQEKP